MSRLTSLATLAITANVSAAVQIKSGQTGPGGSDLAKVDEDLYPVLCDTTMRDISAEIKLWCWAQEGIVTLAELHGLVCDTDLKWVAEDNGNEQEVKAWCQ